MPFMQSRKVLLESGNPSPPKVAPSKILATIRQLSKGALHRALEFACSALRRLLKGLSRMFGDRGLATFDLPTVMSSARRCPRD
jgi:hypothetical protein